MRWVAMTAAIALLLVTLAPAQTMTVVEPDAPGIVEDKNWAFSLTAMTYFVENDNDYISPTFTADRDWLHLEARYNYEALNTGSVWAGYNLSFGDKVVFDVTPMLGGVFGDLTGVAPGYRMALTFGRFELSSEGEYVIDPGNESNNFFYCWTEAVYSPVDWCWFGVVAQRTQAYESDLDIQPGVLVGFAWKRVNFTTYLFNMFLDDPVVVLSIGVDF